MKSIHERDVGDIVTAWCMKCRRSTNHIIIMKQDGQVRKVQCKECRGRHNYKSPVGVESLHGTVRRGSGTVTPLSASVKSARMNPRRQQRRVHSAEEWERKILKAPGEEQPYRPERNYNVGDLIVHATFGQGIVEEVIGLRKLVVYFRDGIKHLVCNYSKGK
jgi:hypothetical protein